MLRAVSNVPVIVATARDDEAETVRALDAGADDYVVKPFAPTHLDARIRAVLRRSATAAAPPVAGRRPAGRPPARGGDPRRPAARPAPAGVRPAGPPRGPPGHRRDEAELLADVWHRPYGGADKTVDVHLSWLRRKLGETAAEPRYLHTRARRRGQAGRGARPMRAVRRSWPCSSPRRPRLVAAGLPPARSPLLSHARRRPRRRVRAAAGAQRPGGRGRGRSTAEQRPTAVSLLDPGSGRRGHRLPAGRRTSGAPAAPASTRGPRSGHGVHGRRRRRAARCSSPVDTEGGRGRRPLLRAATPLLRRGVARPGRCSSGSALVLLLLVAVVVADRLARRTSGR